MNDLEPRVQQLENNHNLLVAELHQINKTLAKMEQTLERFAEIVTKLSVLEEKVHSNTARIKDLEEDSVKIKDNTQRNLWGIIIIFFSSLISFIYQSGK